MNIDLLAQRLAAAEEANSKQAAQIERLQGSQNRLEGAQAQQDKAAQSHQKMIGPAVGIIAALVSFIIGGLLYDGTTTNASDIQSINTQLASIGTRIENAEDHTDDEGHPDKMIARLDVIEDRIATLMSKKHASASAFAAHIAMDSHPKASITMENINTRLRTIEANLTDNVSRFADINASVVSIQANQRSTDAITNEHEEEIDALEDRVHVIGSKVASVQASTGAAFVEVETQIRALNEVSNVSRAAMERLMQILWRGTFKNDLPDNEFFPRDIPAKATTQVGKINGE